MSQISSVVVMVLGVSAFVDRPVGRILKLVFSYCIASVIRFFVSS